VRRVALTLDVEMNCDEAARLSAQVVDALMSNPDLGGQFALVIQHLEECVPCAEEFARLRDCAQMEQEGSWPSLMQLLEKACQGDLNA
jgi:hypothetical protein